MYLGWAITYNRLPNTKNELTLKELIKYLKYQRSLKSFLYGFLPFAPKKIKEYAIKGRFRAPLQIVISLLIWTYSMKELLNIFDHFTKK